MLPSDEYNVDRYRIDGQAQQDQANNAEKRQHVSHAYFSI